MTEADLKRALGDALRQELPGALVLRHEDKFRQGIPDMSVTWPLGRCRTLWMEVKYDRPGVRARLTPLQERTLRRLAGFLVTYYTTGAGVPSVRVSAPGAVVEDLASIEFEGHDHQAVTELVRRRLSL